MEQTHEDPSAERRMISFAEDLVRARPNLCSNCGPWPCYHICPNSPHYYSPEQERADEANYDPSEYYREGGFIDEDRYSDAEPEIPFEPVVLQGRSNPGDTDDIPF